MLEGALQITQRSHADVGKEGEVPGVSNAALGRLAQQLVAMVLPALELQDRIYKGLSRQLFDHLITGRRIEFPDELMNIVVRMALVTEDAPEPVVIAVAHQLSNPDEVTEKFRSRIVETFGKKPKIKKEHLELAQYLARKNTGKTIDDNVTVYLKRHPGAIKYRKGTKKYNEEVKKLKNCMKVSLYRLQQMADEVTGYKKH
jgi:hypothetical protein